MSERWWYLPPWRVSDPWLPTVRWLPHGGDEFCNPTFLVQLPLLGAVVVRYRRGPLRPQACDECVAEDGPWCAGCLSCHEGPRCHPWAVDCRSHDLDECLGVCPVCGGDRCFACEPAAKPCSQPPPGPRPDLTLVKPDPGREVVPHTYDARGVVHPNVKREDTDV